MTREQTYTAMLMVPDEPRSWPTLHDHLFDEVSERWRGTPQAYWRHA